MVFLRGSGEVYRKAMDLTLMRDENKFEDLLARKEGFVSERFSKAQFWGARSLALSSRAEAV